MGDARLYIFHETSLDFKELPKRIWHILFASQGWPFTKGLTGWSEIGRRNGIENQS